MAATEEADLKDHPEISDFSCYKGNGVVCNSRGIPVFYTGSGFPAKINSCRAGLMSYRRHPKNKDYTTVILIRYTVYSCQTVF